MRPARHAHVLRLVVTVAVLLNGTFALAAGVPDFCFLHISDIHVEPAPLGSPPPGPNARSAAALAWIGEQAGRPQQLAPFNMLAPAPAFVINTGDMMEFGAIANTWRNAENMFRALPVPMYFVPGNHDNTWNSMLHIMRQRYRGDNYSFDKFGCHFVGLNTATPQEPLPSIDYRMLAWLSADLAKLSKDTPIFLFCHHPLSVSEFSKPFEQLRLLETIRGYNVVVLLMGHGHAPIHERWGELDSVEGGSTFGPNTGYSIVSVQNNILRVVYRYQDPEKPAKTLLVKPIAARKWPTVDLLAPAESARRFTSSVPVEVRARGAAPLRVRASIDDQDDHTTELKRSLFGYGGKLSTEGLTPGAHFLRISAEYHLASLPPGITIPAPARRPHSRPAGERDHRHRTPGLQPASQEPASRPADPPPDRLALDRATWFVHSTSDSPNETRTYLPAGVKGAPVLVGSDVWVATTGGEIHRANFESRKPSVRKVASVDAIVIAPPAITEKTLYFGASDLAVHAFSLDGHRVWRCQLAGCAYGTPAVAADTVYVADLEGNVYAINRNTGRPRWNRHHAAMGVEHSLLLHDGVLYFGAWDGYLYAVNTSDGSLKWKRPAPAGYSEDKRLHNRYYSPADCPPILVNNRLIVCDRAYKLGSYSLDGEYLGEIAGQIAAVGPAADGQGFYARAMTSLTRYSAEGKPLWSRPLTLGRFPAAPTEAAGKVYVCSNYGLLTVLAADTGEILWQYQVTPRLPVMGAVAVDAEGHAYVAALDSTLTRVWK